MINSISTTTLSMMFYCTLVILAITIVLSVVRAIQDSKRLDDIIAQHLYNTRMYHNTCISTYTRVIEAIDGKEVEPQFTLCIPCWHAYRATGGNDVSLRALDVSDCLYCQNPLYKQHVYNEERRSLDHKATRLLY